MCQAQESNADYERVAMRESDSEENLGDLCALEDPFAQFRPADSEYRVMLKSSKYFKVYRNSDIKVDENN